MTCPPQSHPQELARLRALRDLNILDSDPEEKFDRYTRIGARLLNADFCLISLVDTDRQWFKSDYGRIGCSQTSRGASFCGHTILRQDDRMIIEDAKTHPLFRNNPLVTGEPYIAAYFGINIKANNGLPIGTICAIHQKPRKFTNDDIEAFNDLAACVENEITGLRSSSIDYLTRLPNRRGFFKFATALQERALNQNKQLAFIYIDIDNLKAINDHYGHSCGDQAIQTLANAIKASIRSRTEECDLAVRLSGDEFGVLTISENAESTAHSITKRIKETLFSPQQRHQQRNTHQHIPAIDFSFGTSITTPFFHHTDMIHDLIDKAEVKMRSCKRRRKMPLRWIEHLLIAPS